MKRMNKQRMNRQSLLLYRGKFSLYNNKCSAGCALAKPKQLGAEQSCTDKVSWSRECTKCTLFLVATIFASIMVDLCCVYLLLTLESTGVGKLDHYGNAIWMQFKPEPVLLYFLCALALQIPLYYVAKKYFTKSKRAKWIVGIGCMLMTVAFLLIRVSTYYGEPTVLIERPFDYTWVPKKIYYMVVPVVAGIGNALYHVGIECTISRKWRDVIRFLGMLLAFGSIGIFVGTDNIAEYFGMFRWVCILVFFVILLCKLICGKSEN